MALPQMHYFSDHVHFCAHGSRPQIRAVQVAADMARIPEAVTTDGSDSCGRTYIEDKGDSAAMQVSCEGVQRENEEETGSETYRPCCINA